MIKQNIEKDPPKGPVKFSITLSEEQKAAKQAILHHPFNFIIGKAGSGKTLLACQVALDMFFKKMVNKIIITRPLVTVEEDLGFLPGNIVKKMDPWTRPIFDLFSEHYSKAEVDNLLLNGIIEISPLAFMRGRTFKRCIIIADEMQNSSPNQMKMLTTRIGINTRMII